MQTITHQEAHSLIQYRADQALDVHQKETLNAHLMSCVECADYANQIHEAEVVLRSTLRKQWNIPNPSLRTVDIQARIHPRHRLLDFVTTRSALVGAALLFFVLAYLQFGTRSKNVYSPMPPVGVSAVPTPSLLLTSMQTEFNHCQMIRYRVQPTDTMESLALHFSVSKAALLEINNLRPGIVRLPGVLTVPICKMTPTTTGDAPTFTNTPSLEPITYTPG